MCPSHPVGHTCCHPKRDLQSPQPLGAPFMQLHRMSGITNSILQQSLPALPRNPCRHTPVILHNRSLQRIHQHRIHLLRHPQQHRLIDQKPLRPIPNLKHIPRSRGNSIPIRDPSRQNSIPPGSSTRQSSSIMARKCRSSRAKCSTELQITTSNAPESNGIASSAHTWKFPAGNPGASSPASAFTCATPSASPSQAEISTPFRSR